VSTHEWRCVCGVSVSVTMPADRDDAAERADRAEDELTAISSQATARLAALKEITAWLRQQPSVLPAQIQNIVDIYDTIIPF
jgi:hypothetical protein